MDLSHLPNYDTLVVFMKKVALDAKGSVVVQPDFMQGHFGIPTLSDANDKVSPFFR